LSFEYSEDIAMACPDWWERVIERLNGHYHKYKSTLPGAVFAVETLRDGRLLSSIGEGWSNDTIFEMGSATKPFTAIGVLMALEEHDFLDIDIPVFKLPGMDFYAEDPAKRMITVRHLLQHTSGLPSFRHYRSSQKGPCNDPTGELVCGSNLGIDVGPTVPYTGSPGGTNECVRVNGRCLQSRVVSLEKVSEYVMKTYSPIYEPGKKFYVNNYGFIVAGRIIEQLSGKSMNIYLKEKLFKPLGMTDSFYVAQETGDPEVDRKIDEGVTRQQRDRIADLTVISDDGKLPPEIAPGPNGHWDKFKKGWRLVEAGGGFYSSASDLLSFWAMLRDGGVSSGRRVLSERVTSLLVDDQGFGHTMGFAYVDESERNGEGAKTLMHLGGFNTFYWYDLRRGDPLIAMFLTQRLTTATTLNDDPDVIFRVYAPLVEAGVFGDPLPDELQ
jgi:CubicO group peptidase (beta-lactamase class C family)